MFNFLTDAAAGSLGTMGGMMGILPIALMLVAMYFLMIVPDKKRKKKEEEMRSAVKVGDSVTTIGGIIGNVVDVKDENIVIETSADRVRMELAKWSISTNNTAYKRAQEDAKKAQEAKAKAKAEKKAKKNNDM